MGDLIESAVEEFLSVVCRSLGSLTLHVLTLGRYRGSSALLEALVGAATPIGACVLIGLIVS